MDIGGQEGVWNAVIRMISWMEYSDDYFFYSMEFILNNGRANLQQLLLVNTCDNNILLLDGLPFHSQCNFHLSFSVTFTGGNLCLVEEWKRNY